MRNALGISTGAAGVCSALVSSDETGVQDVEYRIIPADLGTQTDLGDLALSAIDLMTTQVPDGRIEPDAIAVVYRTDVQAAAVRSAAKRQQRPIRLVPETAATLAYLRSTGMIDRFHSVALADLGASGLSVTVLDPGSGTVDVQDRSSAVSADAAADAPIEPIAAAAAAFVADVAGRAAAAPEAVVLVGGGGNIPAVGSAIEAAFDGETILVDEPEAATAKGAALLADSTSRQQFPVVAGSGGTASAALLGVFIVGALLLGYGVRELIPQSEENFAPTGSLVETPESDPPAPSGAPDSPAVHPGQTLIPTADPLPATTWPQPASEVPVPSYGSPTYDYPTYEGPVPTTTSTTTAAPSTTTEPSQSVSPPPPTAPGTDPLPWIPPKWPALPTWLPDIPGTPGDSLETAPDESATDTPLAPPETPALPEEPTTEPEPTTAPEPATEPESSVEPESSLVPQASPVPDASSAPQTSLTPTVSDSPDSPTPAVPDSSPR